MQDAKSRLVDILENAVNEIARCEAEAEKAVNVHGDQAGFEQWMVEKTEIVAGLPEEAGEAARALGGELGDYVLERLETYAASAETALEINSPFYMSALLYPSTHEPGQPSNLERVLERVRREG
ncbi:hypothetical protein [Salidesulfovibrio brasiliensis]|uniref:hypothetical protein n=1 Tax=Salidesulfovibrio brasiliensis TaxID=221711 RepID=UPI0006D14AB7|nr:hypothetical protein [Salidesulfovibrio brasiliensis]